MSVDNTDLFEQWIKTSPDRFSSDFIEARLSREQRKAAYHLRKPGKSGSFKPNIRTLTSAMLKYTGLRGVGRRNAEHINVRHQLFSIRNLPQAFNGYRILHISDTHFNCNTNLERNLHSAIESAEYDLCVLTGDYRFRSFGSIGKAVDGLSKLMNAVNTKVLAVLGNHDSILMTPHMEKLGINVLINERSVISLNDEKITFVGVDDPSYYKLHDIQSACGHVGFNDSDCAILLAHSPELYKQASQHGFAAYLCGHTHGGQICLPGGYPIKRNTDSPRWADSGQWHYRGTSGYTCAGVGTSIVEARFFCPPEIVVHELTRTDAKVD